MIQDKQTTFDDNQAITVTANSANVYDAGVARDLGPGRNLYVVATVDVAFTAGGAATLRGQFVGADDAALTSNVVTLLDSGVIGKATLVAGYAIFNGPMPAIPANARKRYYGIIWTVATGPMTAGKITSRWQLDTVQGGVYTAVQPNSF